MRRNDLADVTGRTACQLTVGGRVYEIRPFPLEAIVQMEQYLRAKATEQFMRVAAAAARMVPTEQLAVYWEQVFRACQTQDVDQSAHQLSAADNMAGALWAGLYAAHRHEFSSPADPKFQEFLKKAVEEHGWEKLAAVLKTYCQLDVTSRSSDDSGEDGKKDL